MTVHARRRGLVLAVILVGYLLVLIDVSILMVALPVIHHDLGFSATSLSWAQNANTLTFGGLQLLGAVPGTSNDSREALLTPAFASRLEPGGSLVRLG